MLGEGGQIETATNIIARRSEQANRMYEAAYARPIDYASREGQTLPGLLERVPNEVRREANNILKISDRDGHQLIWSDVPDEAGRYALNAMPNMRQWSYLKQGLDASIERNSNPLTGELNTMGAASVGLKQEMLSSLDKLNPMYRAARQDFAGETELLTRCGSGNRHSSRP